MSRGLDRERKLRDILRRDGWVVVRAAMGAVDLVVMRRMSDPVFTALPGPVGEICLVQVKSTAGGPYERFGPTERQELLDLAEQAGATAWLAWWPPRKPIRWIPSTEWPHGVRRHEP